MTRHFWVLLHRYAGLYMAFFLTVAGLTGSVLAFIHELGDWLNPEHLHVLVQDRPMLDVFTLREKALALEPHAQFNAVAFDRQPGRAFVLLASPAIDPATSAPYALDYTDLRLNPYSGEIVGFDNVKSNWPLTRHNILDFIYALHYSLAMGEIGTWLFGIAALIWTIDCFVSVYLTFPLSVRRHQQTKSALKKSWWSRWQPSWLIKWRASTFRINFDLHRAGGLWTWAMLFVFAWSSVAFNLGQQVYIPVMQQLFEMSDYKNLPIPDLEQPRPNPVIDFKTAHQISQHLMSEQAQQKGFQVLEESSLGYDPAKGLYNYAVKSDYDIGMFGVTLLWIDGNSGALVAHLLPTGQKAGDTITYWLQVLHMAKIWGLPYKIFVCLMGLVVAMLSVTGVYIWWKKRRAATLSRHILRK